MADFNNYFYKQVIKLASKGYSDKQIAEKFCVPVSTIEIIIFREFY